MRIPATKMLRSTLATVALMALMLHPAAAQHSGHQAAAGDTPPAQATPAAQAFQAANAKMHQEMAIDATGNADVDYVKQRIPPHQGAIDRSRVVLQYGNDPQIRQLAEKIIKDQEREIAPRRAWLKEKGQ